MVLIRGCSTPIRRRMPGSVISMRSDSNCEAVADCFSCVSVAATRSSTSFLSSLTRRPTSRLASFGAAFNHRSLICVRIPFLRAIQRSRNSFHSASEPTAPDSDCSAEFRSATAPSSEETDQSSSLGTVYILSSFLSFGGAQRRGMTKLTAYMH